MDLSKLQVTLVEKAIQDAGFEYAPLQDEILDHLCCLTEEQMRKGLQFESAMDAAFNILGPEDLKKCQKETHFLLNRKQIFMKRITIAASIVAVGSFLITTVIFAQNTPSVMPLSKYEITSPFGKRADPFTKKFKHHFGIDLKAPTGTPVIATANGTVIEVKEQPDGYGKYVIIEHADNYQTKYAQLSEFKVSVGSQVKQGNVIGLVGSSGRSTAPHLHYEVILDGKRIDPATTVNDS